MNNGTTSKLLLGDEPEALNCAAAGGAGRPSHRDENACTGVIAAMRKPAQAK